MYRNIRMIVNLHNMYEVDKTVINVVRENDKVVCFIRTNFIRVARIQEFLPPANNHKPRSELQWMPSSRTWLFSCNYEPVWYENFNKTILHIERRTKEKKKLTLLVL